MKTSDDLDSAGGPTPRIGNGSLIALVLVLSFAVALYLELLGWRIVEPGLSLTEAWGRPFVLGALRTTTGALTLGLVFAGFGVLVGRLLPALRIFWAWWLAAGSALFLLLVAALVAWAP